MELNETVEYTLKVSKNVLSKLKKISLDNHGNVTVSALISSFIEDTEHGFLVEYPELDKELRNAKCHPGIYEVSHFSDTSQDIPSEEICVSVSLYAAQKYEYEYSKQGGMTDAFNQIIESLLN